MNGQKIYKHFTANIEIAKNFFRSQLATILLKNFLACPMDFPQELFSPVSSAIEHQAMYLIIR